MMSPPQAVQTLSAEVTATDFLRRMGESGEGPHDVAAAALMLSALDRPDKKLAPFRAHLEQLAEAVRNESHFARDAETAARALSSVIAVRYGYEGERENYDD